MTGASAVNGLAGPSRHRGAWWSLFCISGGLVLLVGEPRAISNVAVIVLIYLVMLLRESEQRKQLLGSIIVAVPVIVALGALQLLPGLAFLSDSQRSNASYGFFTRRSLPPPLLPKLTRISL